jgi:phosphate transport system substrate-binding protein
MTKYPAARLAFGSITLAAVVLLAACGPQDGLTGSVSVDGSSTVFPITEAVAEEFRFVAPNVRATVGISGTGGGFKRFCAGEIDISNASRPIKPSEREACGEKGVDYLELVVAYDGLSVVTNLKNDFVDNLTLDELRRIWEPNSKVNRWNQVRPEWPDERIVLFGPDTESGTFDYFTETIMGAEDASRFDYTASSDDNVLVHGVSGEEFALGYFGFAFYAENPDKLRLIPVDGGDGPIAPSQTTISNGTYAPLSRPLFLYVNTELLRESLAVQEFIDFYLTDGPELVPEVGYVPLPDDGYLAALASVAHLLEEGP